MVLKINPEDRLAPGPKPSNRPIIVITLIVSTIVSGFGWKLYKEDQEKNRKLESLERHNAELKRQEEQWRAEAEAKKPKVERTPHYYELNPEEREAEKPIRIVAPGERQTVFNDRNYTPKGAVNSVAPPAQRHYNNSPVRRTQQPPQQRVAPWKWETFASGGRKKWESGHFTYMVQAGRVDTGSVCKNEKYGSFRYRDCRKGAKAYFTQRCRSGDKIACSGQNMTP